MSIATTLRHWIVASPTPYPKRSRVALRTCEQGRTSAPHPGAPRPQRSSRNRRKLAKRNIVLGLVSFVVLQLVGFVFLQWNERLRDPQFGDKHQQLRRVLASREHPQLLLALGSSRTGMGFHGKLISERFSVESGQPVVAFNFGIPAVGPVLELTYLKRLLQDGIRPDLVLLEVHPALLSNQLGEPIEKRGLYVEQLRESEVESIQQFGYLGKHAKSDWWEANLCPTHGARFALLGRVLPNWLPTSTRFDWGRRTDSWGWNACYWVDPSPQLRQSAVEAARKEYELLLQELRFETAPVDALQQILALLKQHQIPVDLVLMPEGPTFRSWYPQAVQQRLDEFLRSLDTPVIDARTWVPEEEFLDSHHLLQNGARRFSQRLADELIGRSIRQEEASLVGMPRPNESSSVK